MKILFSTTKTFISRGRTIGSAMAVVLLFLSHEARTAAQDDLKPSSHSALHSDSKIQEPAEHLRIATFNVSMNRSKSGELLKDLASNSEQIRKVASIIRLHDPDIILLNEFDFDSKHAAVQRFVEDFLSAEREDLAGSPVRYPHVWTAPVNTGVPSFLDLNRNGKQGDWADNFGFGKFPGQYGMVLLSKYPIVKDHVRTFQNLLWSHMPDSAVPMDTESGKPWYSDEVWKQLRLSSKSHWDVPIQFKSATIHILASHPTPPAFDGAEDRNGCRNHDEIRFWTDYLTARRANWIVDDLNQKGGMLDDDPFLLLGDLNSDPVDGDSRQDAILNLLNHPSVNSKHVPVSDGAAEASAIQKRVNMKHQGRPDSDTADFSDGSVGNLRVDYVIPSRQLKVLGCGVFWPVSSHPDAKLLDCSDHRLIWMDVVPMGR